MSYKHISVPESGDMIVVNADNSLSVPDNPIIPYIEGDGIGVDISPVMIAVVDAAIAKAYDNARQISWMEIYTGEKAAELWSWIERGAHIYVCGDANRMAKDVHTALIETIAPHGQLDQEKAEEFLTQLKREKRYQRDVY